MTRSVTIGCILLTLASTAMAQSFRRAVSLHAGVAVPSGTFANVVDPGPTVNLDVIFPLAPHFAWDLRGGLARFPGSGGAGDVKIWDISTNLKWMAVVSTPWIFVNGGFGVYRVESVDWYGGANAGIGAGRPGPSPFDLEITINYHRVFTPGDDVAYWKFQLGLLRPF